MQCKEICALVSRFLSSESEDAVLSQYEERESVERPTPSCEILQNPGTSCCFQRSHALAGFGFDRENLL